MARYEQILTGYWTAPSVVSLSYEAKNLYLYLITCERSHGLSGIYQLAPKTILDETGLDPRLLEAVLEELETAGKLRRYESNWVWVVKKSWHKVRNAKHWANVVRHLATNGVPDALTADFSKRYTCLQDKYGAI